MQPFLRTYRYFLIPVLLFIAIGLVGMLFLEKGEATLSLNGLHHSVLDQFFKYTTYLGEWLGGLLVGLFLLFGRPVKYLSIYLIAILCAFGGSQLLKRQVFEENGRPASQYEDQLHQVDGVVLYKHYSFPSGHTTAAFCMFSILAFTLVQRGWQLGSALIAVLVGVSRMYLGQHYLMDVVAGACLGTFVAVLVFSAFNGRWSGEAWNRRLFDKK